MILIIASTLFRVVALWSNWGMEIITRGNVLFVKWRENWNSLMAEMNEGDELNTFDWEAAEGSAQETVARGVRDWAIYVKEHNHQSSISCST